jgi:hypothetical protein
VTALSEAVPEPDCAPTAVVRAASNSADPAEPQGTAAASGIRTVGVVVPARNEEARLPRCLDALLTAKNVFSERHPEGPAVRIIVVVDLSTDRTLHVAEQWPGIEVVLSESGRVGAARAAGVDHLLASEARGGLLPASVWIACTDADSAVPADWLTHHLQTARCGAQMILGTVRPDAGEIQVAVLEDWRRRHVLGDGHPNIHGANLGVRGDIYCAAGGFVSAAVDEDVLLVRAVRAAGGLVVSSGAIPVLTSARTEGRTVGGFAHYLRALHREHGGTDDQFPGWAG